MSSYANDALDGTPLVPLRRYTPTRIEAEEWHRYCLRRKLAAPPGSALHTVSIDELWAEAQLRGVRQRDWSPFLSGHQHGGGGVEEQSSKPPSAAAAPASFPTPPPFGGARGAPEEEEEEDDDDEEPSLSSFASELDAVLAMLPTQAATPVTPVEHAAARTPLAAVDSNVRAERPSAGAAKPKASASMMSPSSAIGPLAEAAHAALMKLESEAAKPPPATQYPIQSAGLPPWLANAVRCFLCLPRHEEL